MRDKRSGGLSINTCWLKPIQLGIIMYFNAYMYCSIIKFREQRGSLKIGMGVHSKNSITQK